MMKKPSKDDLKIIFLWLFSFTVIIFMITLTAHAEEPSYFPMGQNDNNKITENYINLINQRIGNNDDKYVLIKYAGKNGSNTLVDVAYWNKADGVYVYGEVKNNGYQWSLYKVGSKSVNYRQFVFSSNGTVGGIYQESISLFQNINSSLYSTSVSYVSNFQLYSTNAEDRQIILAYTDGPLINVGAAALPLPFIVPSYVTGDTPPTTVPPSYTINNYTWTTAPSFDNSSIINGIQSIKDTLEWLSDNLHAELSNLINNIKGLVEYLGKTLQYYGNAIIETLNNLIQNFYDNMVALIEPIVSDLNELKQNFLEFADLFIHPFDEEEFEEQIENCQLISQYNELMDNADDIRAIFNNAEERDYFVLYIDFENPFADSEHKIIHSEISFTWLKDYRSTYRPFLWLFTMIECFVGGMRLLGGIIGGKAK